MYKAMFTCHPYSQRLTLSLLDCSANLLKRVDEGEPMTRLVPATNFIGVIPLLGLLGKLEVAESYGPDSLGFYYQTSIIRV